MTPGHAWGRRAMLRFWLIMMMLLNDGREVGTEDSSPSAEGLLGPAGDALWRQLSKLRNEVISYTDTRTSGENVPLDGLWADRTNTVHELALKALHKNGLIKLRCWGVFQNIQQRLAYPGAWPSAQEGQASPY